MKSSRVFAGVFIALIILIIGWAILASNLGTPNPFLEIPKYLPYGDKIGHFLAFGILAGSLHFVSGSWRLMWIPVWPALVLTFAFVEEFSQLFLDRRTFNWWDLLADVVGVVLATVLVEALEKKLSRNREVRSPSRSENLGSK